MLEQYFLVPCWLLPQLLTQDSCHPILLFQQGMDDSRFNSWQEKRDFLFSKMSKSALAQIKPPIQLVPKVLLLEVKWSNVKLTTNLHLVPRVRMCRTTWPHHMQTLPSNFQKAQNSISTMTRLWDELLRKSNSVPGMTTSSGVLPASYTVATRVPFCQGLSCWGMKLPAHLHLVPRWSMSGAINPLPHMPSWHTFTFHLFSLVALWMCAQLSQQFTCAVYSVDSTKKAHRDR